MKLLTKINEFAKQRSIYLIVIHLQRRCFAGRETAMAILQKAKQQCGATGVCPVLDSRNSHVVCHEILQYHLIFLLPQNPPDGQLVVEWWSKCVRIKPSTTSYVVVSLSVKRNWWSNGRFFQHCVCVCVRTCARRCARNEVNQRDGDG